jgi:hypothetical protein
MKKFFLTLLFTCGFFLLISQNEMLWSKRRFLDEPRVHRVQKGESLSKLAKQHYGSPKRWRELALVNRAPKPNHLEVGEEILLPSATVINALRRSRTITRVNTLVGGQEGASTAKTPAITQQPAPAEAPAVDPEKNELVPETSPETIVPPQDAPAEASAFPWFWLAIGVMLIAGAAGFIWYRRQQAEKAEAENATKMVEPRRHLDDRSRERQAFTKPPAQKENLAV